MAPSKQKTVPYSLDIESAVKILNTIEQDFYDFVNKMNFTIASLRSLVNYPPTEPKPPKAVALKEAVRLLREYYANKFYGSANNQQENTNTNNLEDQPHQNLDSVNKELIKTVNKVVKRRRDTIKAQPTTTNETEEKTQTPETKPQSIKRKRIVEQKKPAHDEEWYKKYVEENPTVNEVDTQPLVL